MTGEPSKLELMPTLRAGRYTSLSTWSEDENGNLRGFLELPLAVGTVGGATRVHPAASFKVNESAKRLTIG